MIRLPPPLSSSRGRVADPGTQRRTGARSCREHRCLTLRAALRVAAVAAPLGPGFRWDDDSKGEEVTLRPIQSVIALQLRQAMKDRNLTLSTMAAEMAASRAQLNRVLDPDANVTLETLSRAAKVVGRGLKVELV